MRIILHDIECKYKLDWLIWYKRSKIVFFFIIVMFDVDVFRYKSLNKQPWLEIFSVFIENLNLVWINIEAAFTKLDNFWWQFEEILTFHFLCMNHDFKPMCVCFFCIIVELKESKQTNFLILQLNFSSLPDFFSATFLTLSFILLFTSSFKKLFCFFFIIPTTTFVLRIFRTIMVSYIKW